MINSTIEELNLCNTCFVMTWHEHGICQKCKPKTPKRTQIMNSTTKKTTKSKKQKSHSIKAVALFHRTNKFITFIETYGNSYANCFERESAVSELKHTFAACHQKMRSVYCGKFDDTMNNHNKLSIFPQKETYREVLSGSAICKSCLRGFNRILKAKHLRPIKPRRARV